MTRKRFVKLLMSQGYSRNGAESQAKTINQNGMSYAEGYEVEVDMQRKAIELMPTIIECLVRAFDAFSLSFSAAAEALSGFGLAYAEYAKRKYT